MNNDKQKRRSKLEIKFDSKARLEYLTGFSNRKKKRRTFGLAMQKVKDRKIKLEQRKEIRRAQLEKLEELEEQREMESDHLFMNPIDEEDQESPGVKVGFGRNPQNEVKQLLSEDVNIFQPLSADSTQQSEEVTTAATDSSIFGGQKVIVRTSYGLPEDSDEEADKNALVSRGKKLKGVDVEQRHAGSVKRYIAALKGKPAKNLKAGRKKMTRKGKHGASNMVGIGGAANLKLARKTLARAETQQKNKGGIPSSKRKGNSRR